ncbi:hypothetical protein DFH06DRAFT_1221889 [Mycena polygramma]|nr:hypothetical protein DFH06DRAFT_1221889 [Mycena polygramma]
MRPSAATAGLVSVCLAPGARAPAHAEAASQGQLPNEMECSSGACGGVVDLSTHVRWLPAQKCDSVIICIPNNLKECC